MDLLIILQEDGKVEDETILDAIFYASGLVWDFLGRSMHRSVVVGVSVEGQRFVI